MTPICAKQYLSNLIKSQINQSVMILGSSGIGKSEIPHQVATEQGFSLLRLHPIKIAQAKELLLGWFSSREIETLENIILFFDDFHLAPINAQQLAWQLLAKRCIGSFVIPRSCLVWAAGRFPPHSIPPQIELSDPVLLLQLKPDLESFKAYAQEKNLHKVILAFLECKRERLHQADQRSPAGKGSSPELNSGAREPRSVVLRWGNHPRFPAGIEFPQGRGRSTADSPKILSPRSWISVNELVKAGLEITPLVGPTVAAEFEDFAESYLLDSPSFKSRGKNNSASMFLSPAREAIGEGTTQERLGQLSQESLALGLLVAQNRATGAEILQNLAYSKDFRTRQATASHPHLPIPLLLELACEFPQEVLKLSRESVDWVYRFSQKSLAALASEKLSPERLEAVWQRVAFEKLSRENIPLLVSLARNPNTAVNILEALELMTRSQEWIAQCVQNPELTVSESIRGRQKIRRAFATNPAIGSDRTFH